MKLFRHSQWGSFARMTLTTQHGKLAKATIIAPWHVSSIPRTYPPFIEITRVYLENRILFLACARLNCPFRMTFAISVSKLWKIS